MKDEEIRNNLADLRAKRGMSAAELATAIGVTRQTIYAIEAGDYVPNTIVSLRMAQALDATVEDIFQVENASPKGEQIVEATLIPSAEKPRPGQPVCLCNVNGRTVAFLPAAGELGLSSVDGFLVKASKTENADYQQWKVQARDGSWSSQNRILVAGCDPSASVIAGHLQRLQFELLISYQNSSRALDLLKNGLVHLAGSHLADKTTGEFDSARIREMFGKNSPVVICYATWEEGFTVAKGNPKNVKGVKDLSRRDVRITNRESGAACRDLLDSLLRHAGLASKQVNGYDTVAFGHMPAAKLVQKGEVDCCIATRAVARALALDFIPIVQRPYHLLTRRNSLKLPAMQALLELLGRASLRREVEASTGYDMHRSGEIVG